MHTAANGLLHIAPSGAGAAATANAPDGIAWGIAQKFGVGLIHTILAVDCVGRAWIEGYDGITWNGWQPIATAAPPQIFDLPLADGFADNGGACYCKTQEGIVYVNAVLKSDTTREATSVGCVVGTLPAGFRPPNSVFTATLFDTGDMGGRILGRLAVRTNGQIVVANVTSSWDRCFGYIVFVAAS